MKAQINSARHVKSPDRAKLRFSPKQAWAREQIRTAVEALQHEKAPLAALTHSQIAARCARWMRERQGKLDAEIPRPRSFERHLPGILAEVLAGSSIG
jgi:hypothetical protein